MTVQAFLYVAVLGVHFLAAALLIGVILVQGGKGASMANTFTGGGGGGATLSRTDEIMLRATRWSAGIFLVTSMALTLLGERGTSAIQRSSSSTFEQRGSEFPPPPAAAQAPAPEAATSPSASSPVGAASPGAETR